MKRKFILVYCILMLAVFSVASAALNQNSYFDSVTGVIREVGDREKGSSNYSISLDNEDGRLVSIVVSEDTYLDKGVKRKLEPGQKITAFYMAYITDPMTNPPQYPVSAIVIPKDKKSVKADRFDAKGLSMDGTMKIRIDLDTEIMDQDGKTYKDSLDNKNLLIFYSSSEGYAPEKVEPERVVVLNKSKEIFEESKVMPAQSSDVSRMPIVVDGRRISSPPAYNKADGTVMIPAKAVIEALGHRVTWMDRERAVQVDGVSSFVVNQNRYNFGRMSPVALEVAPEIRNGVTYVPLSYFQKVLKIENAYVYEGQIVFDHGPKMK